ncbi:hypothetical protein A8H35_07245 [Burkholderia thailandensis]|nr:hypothetical protein A8H35_07245 [Burkholderia thailandensis]AWY67561.1 hypothetical protein A8H36_21090 [Burkholderia thailandensis]PHH36729.1 hypothetical protein CRX59_08535 [Burkholderia thailandensis]
MAFHAHCAALYINENGRLKNDRFRSLILSMIETIDIEPPRAAADRRDQYNRGF